ncbi:AGE family epimerase/isomerase [Sphingomonas naphthae]|uniref:AGE family epimerase/isomerase n=1 Tax=Sphingomonas naphthae TaxID=1813468 RepID=A0ABY7TPM7_9SPHN|nr:AGE family epimerase/isomerase [Sphingomonas naphthae]WCT75196.1 AGE family epimerase/isomerase [Sphingomonas naphthae]
MDVFDGDRRWAAEWLFGAALPIWWDAGADRRHGGWFDRLDQSGKALDMPKRARVQARQAFTYAEAGKLGWAGPWQDAVAQGVDFLLKAYAREDGLYRKSVTVEGAVLDDGFDLYDQAFVLLALASGYETLGKPPELLRAAEALLVRLGGLAHPMAGFEEDRPRRLPLRSNPHMHLLEALLAWVAIGGSDMFAGKAREIVNLALSRMIDPVTGAVGEYYDGDWRFMAGEDGQIREPGHQFEWAYLLTEADRLLGGDNFPQASRLEAFGAKYGVDAPRKVAFFSTDATGAPIDGTARLWAQTERLRTALVFGRKVEGAEKARLDTAALDAFGTLRRFLEVPVPGLWLDRMLLDGSIVDEPATASSFYHIMTGLLPLLHTGSFDPTGRPAVAAAQ